MAVAKQKYNSKMPKVSGIKFCTNGYKNQCEHITTSEGGRFSIQVCFKQPGNRNSFSSYQVQYREHSKYNAANAKKQGTDWTAWSPWKNMIEFKSGKTTVKVGSTKDPDTWFIGNRGIWKNNTYVWVYKFENAGISSNFCRRAYQVRIRTWNYKTKQHGAWVSSNTLAVSRSPWVVDEWLYRAADDGGLIVDFNHDWDRGCNAVFASIKDSAGRELLKSKNASVSVNYDAARSATTKPAKRTSGYWFPGRAKVPLSKLKRAIEYNEHLTVSAYFYTDHYSKTYFHNHANPWKVAKAVTDIDAPRITLYRVEEECAISVHVWKGKPSDTVQTGGITCKYMHNGKWYSITRGITRHYEKPLPKDPTKLMSAWFPHLPLNTELTFDVTVGNNYYDSEKTSAKTTFKTGRAWYLAKENDSRKCRAVLELGLNDYPEFSVRASSKSRYELTYGRVKPFAAFSPGSTNVITLNGVIPESASDAGYTHPRCLYRHWAHIKENLDGTYILRGPNGEMFKVLIEELDFRRTAKGRYEVSASFVEVE